tara:strand:+ start:403 stop:627 length:225 start_codon:yes stop_codon:yes gene_type:complete
MAKVNYQRRNLLRGGHTMNDRQKLNWISFAIQEAINGNKGELMQALNLVEELRDPPPEEWMITAPHQAKLDNDE